MLDVAGCLRPLRASEHGRGDRRQDTRPSLGPTRGNIMRPTLHPLSFASGRKSLFFSPDRGKVMHTSGNFMSPVACCCCCYGGGA